MAWQCLQNLAKLEDLEEELEMLEPCPNLPKLTQAVQDSTRYIQANHAFIEARPAASVASIYGQCLRHRAQAGTGDRRAEGRARLYWLQQAPGDG